MVSLVTVVDWVADEGVKVTVVDCPELAVLREIEVGYDQLPVPLTVVVFEMA